MKTTIMKRFIVLGALSGALCTAYADKVQIEQLPRELQTKIRAHTGSERIEDIDRRTKDGQTTYEVAFKRDGEHTELRFNQQGQLLNEDGSALPATAKVEFEQLPPLVQQAIKTRVRTGEINDIDRRVRNGEVVYEVGFKHSGVQQELLLSDEGRILRDVSYDASLATAGPNNAAGATPDQTRRNPREMLSQSPVKITGAQKISLDLVPEDVRRVITSRARGARIEDVELGIWNNQPIYQAGFKSRGEHVELQVARGGTIVHDPRFANVGTPAGGVIGRSPGTANNTPAAQPSTQPGQSGHQPATLAALQEISSNDVPFQVRRALDLRAPQTEAETIHRGIWNDSVIYQVGFIENGQYQQLQLDQSGKLIYDSRRRN